MDQRPFLKRVLCWYNGPLLVVGMFHDLFMKDTYRLLLSLFTASICLKLMKLMLQKASKLSSIVLQTSNIVSTYTKSISNIAEIHQLFSRNTDNLSTLST